MHPVFHPKLYMSIEYHSRLEVPQEYLEHEHSSLNSSSSRLLMELFAVVCIETSHYVSFVKCGPGPDAPWSVNLAKQQPFVKSC